MSFPTDANLPPSNGMDPMQQGSNLPVPYGGGGAMQPAEDPGLPAPSTLFIKRPEVDYRVPFSMTDREALGRRIRTEIQRFRQAVNPRRRNCIAWRRDWEMLESDQPVPWVGAARQRVPFTRMACDAHALRLQQATCGIDPPMQAIARKPEVQDLAPEIEGALSDLLDQADWETVAWDVHQELALTAECLLWVTWDTETALCPVHTVEHDEPTATALVERGIMDPMRAMEAATETDAKGELKVYFDWEESTVFDGVRLRAVPFLDVVTLPASARDPKQLWALGERLVLQGRDLREGVRAKRYYEDAVNELLERRSDGVSSERQELNTLSGVQGETYPEDESDADYREYECCVLAIRGKWLKGNSKWKDREVWGTLTIHEPDGKVLGFEYSPYRHGRAPAVLFRYQTRPGERYGMAVPEIVASLQTQATACINSFLDLVQLIVEQGGTLLTEGGSGFRRDAFPFGAGQLITVDDVNALKPLEVSPQLNGALEALMKVLEVLRNWNDYLTGTSNPTLGKETEGQKTLGEIKIAVSKGDQQFEERAKQVGQLWAQAADRVRFLAAQFGTKDAVDAGGVPVIEYRVSENGKIDLRTLPAHLLASDIDLKPAAVSHFPDQQSAMQVAAYFMQLTTVSPIFQASPDATLTVLQNLLQKARFPWPDRLLNDLRNGIQQQQQMQQAQMLMAAQQQDVQAQAQSQQQAQDAQGRSVEQGQRQQELQQGQQAQEFQQGMAQQEAQRAAEAHQAQMMSGQIGDMGALAALMQPAVNGKAKVK